MEPLRHAPGVRWIRMDRQRGLVMIEITRDNHFDVPEHQEHQADIPALARLLRDEPARFIMLAHELAALDWISDIAVIDAIDAVSRTYMRPFILDFHPELRPQPQLSNDSDEDH
ncbi:hypothetical protein JCM24511_03761 [Saitozyma sp. JCM 24511]|nr:hypothetical protein JCM24511_03761 [Saitozyma sp. JCM 24511]